MHEEYENQNELTISLFIPLFCTFKNNEVSKVSLCHASDDMVTHVDCNNCNLLTNSATIEKQPRKSKEDYTYFRISFLIM